MAVIKLEPHVPDDALSFMNLLGYGSRNYTAIDPRGALPTQDTDDINELQDLSDGGYNIYYCPNSIDGKRKDSNVTHVRAVWIDDDKGEVDVSKLPLPPSITVHTSPSKFQYLWLTETTHISAASNINLGLAQKFGGDLKVFNPSRILRLPGFPNRKYPENPMVTYELHSDEVIPWPLIVAKFPIAEAPEKPKEFGKSTFSFRDAISDILTGENVHGSRIALAMHCANIGMPKKDVLDLLNSHVTDAVRNGTVEIGRAMERMANMQQCVESAYEKLELESAPLIVPDGNVTKFTQIPDLPDGGLKHVVEACLKTMRYQSFEMAVPTAMHLISTYGGGLYAIGSQTMSRSRVILARTGAGKNAISTFNSIIIKKLVKKGINAYNFHCSESFNLASDVHSELCEFRVRGHFIEEAGENARSGLGAKSENRAFILKALTCGTLKSLDPKKFSGRTAGNRQANELLKPLWGICYSVLSESVPESYVQVIKDEGQFTDGLVPRQELIFVNPHKPYRNKDQIFDVSDEAMNIFESLSTSFIALRSERGDNPDNADMFKCIDTSEIDVLLDGLEDEFVDKQNMSHDDDVSHAMYSRFAEKVSGTILLQAVADAALQSVNGTIPHPKATRQHFEWAVSYHNALVDTILSQADTGILADSFSKCCSKLYDSIKTFGSRAFDKDYKDRIVTMSWITKVLDRTKVKAVNDVIQNVYRGNRITFNKDIVAHAVENGWLLDVVQGNRKVKSWKINPMIRSKK